MRFCKNVPEMRLIRKLTFLSIVLYITLQGCNKADNAQTIPAYIVVNEFTLSTTSVQGTNSHQITDAWIFVDDKLMGVFELPARVPTLSTGQQNVKIFAGIKNNGQSDDRVRYPFYTNYDATVDLIPDSSITINPSIGYIADLDIWEENFEDGGISFSKTSLSDTNFTQDNTDPFEGSKSGVVSFASTDLFLKRVQMNPPLITFRKLVSRFILSLITGPTTLLFSGYSTTMALCRQTLNWLFLRSLLKPNGTKPIST